VRLDAEVNKKIKRIERFNKEIADLSVGQEDDQEMDQEMTKRLVIETPKVGIDTPNHSRSKSLMMKEYMNASMNEGTPLS